MAVWLDYRGCLSGDCGNTDDRSSVDGLLNSEKKEGRQGAEETTGKFTKNTETQIHDGGDTDGWGRRIGRG